ncbi:MULTISPECIES: MFS transporter [unclassified Pseudomonas]|uniref:MFS transporter n=1 Tax=unclassified Pseudomonas TaxID=196821 RepID=UPI000BC4AE34|nr:MULTISPECIES: MFS transporter [unclassified Pseudomonas]PVZ19849.1 putative MFS family arabinose efflux permease [Pseudomonas sp. URIL14HWK12:I12]PVZ26915.1 putative MFS family arabinose efflux permease [Pseudomonas sp. URIL14HWK12:I10]PVZ37804.1 putative MFS family arabinose efflux permease [Pseudomonas sp. URIL14HWK12:I11]SNZ05602.1 Predicted arabinose efflux permease, MFS family [Pseudomonas sp. URIL14HWK12:I9]
MPDSDSNPHWRRNLAVCVFGSFTTLIAMTLLLPFLPLYVAQLGVHDASAVVQWSGVAFGATFFSAALTAPLWGRLGDRYGRKLMLIRASLGMAIAMSLIGLAQDVYQLVALRLLAGLLGGYASGSTILVATQTPKGRSAWALGTLASGVMAGNVAGPLIGGMLPPLIGIRGTFLLAGGVIFIAFLATAFLLKEEPRTRSNAAAVTVSAAELAPVVKRQVWIMYATAAMLMFATLSIEPIITVYLQALGAEPLTLMAGLAMAATALGSILAAPRVGKLADQVGHWKTVAACLALAAATVVPQAVLTNSWQLIGWRFVMGLALGGLLPCVAAIIRHSVPNALAGRMLGYSTSAQYAGQVLGPLAGGFIAGHIGMRAVFALTALLMMIAAGMVLAARPRPAVS